MFKFLKKKKEVMQKERISRIREPYLVQRLKLPFKKEGQSDIMKAMSTAFSFGGGLVNGGLSKEAFGLISEICRYDYMGSAEFEYGALPKSLEKIGDLAISKDLIKFELPVKAKAYNYKLSKDIEANATVYFICDVLDKDTISGYITKLSNKNSGFHTKEWVGLAESICGFEYKTDVVGWHDIDNHYLFFTDKNMYDNWCSLLGLK